jgi:myo-inositol-1(or 4)-monophosphatase
MKRKKSFLNVAIEAATEVGEILLKDFNKTKILKYKDRQDIVTNVDIKAETLIIKKIKENFPDHNIFSEEKGRENLNSKYTWVIDPLDGTKHYLRKTPIFCTSIALQKDGEVILGVVYAPMLKSFFMLKKEKELI